MQCLHKIFEPKYEEPTVQMRVIDGAAFLNTYPPMTSKMFEKYCEDELVKVVYSSSEGFDRMDFVFDRYLKNNIKIQTCEGRGKRMFISVRNNNPLCEDFKTFM